MAGVSSRSLAYRIQRFAYYRSYFPSLGLWRDDLRRDTPVLKEALSRLPRTDVEGRNFRIARAVVLHNAKMMLPRDQWTELDDVSLLYLFYKEGNHQFLLQFNLEEIWLVDPKLLGMG
ncbi:cytochrome b-c1 complex subunit 7-like isoform X1 [Ostrea edulis]|uniref:cytochrome b-c1 complex subunit 7-like isoform X1 n=1 Tax=Ostrea edulis TaxID=37623 RepID=UPI0024AF778E|nr:cytochrome b-c1 complex subunit 7-like isoform X1 [Ostrea edulis]